MSVRSFFVSLWFSMFSILNSAGCTVFYVSKEGVVYAGNNEDWKDPNCRMWFYPAEENKHGWVKFGWAGGFPQGGMNDRGVFWDATAGPYLGMPVSEANKSKYSGPLMQKVIEECANIGEALVIFNQYYCDDQYKAQYLVGDSTGYSVIVEGDSILHNKFSFQILTNFIQSHPDLGGYPCWRYNAAYNLLINNNELTPYFIGTVLASTHQEGAYPTQYSNIYDLKKCLVYLFYFHNYEEYITINLDQELKKGYRYYDIPELFSRITSLHPENGTIINSNSVTITWRGFADSYYELIYTTDPDFTDTESISKSTIQITHAGFSNLFFLLLSFFLLIIQIGFRSKRIGFFLMICFFPLFLNSKCQKDINPPDGDNLSEIKETIWNLEPNTTYYWKIRAHTGYTDDFLSESLTFHFKTSSR
jgi:hypothetical protein